MEGGVRTGVGERKGWLRVIKCLLHSTTYHIFIGVVLFAFCRFSLFGCIRNAGVRIEAQSVGIYSLPHSPSFCRSISVILDRMRRRRAPGLYHAG